MAEAAEAASSSSDAVDIKFVIVPEGFSHSRSFAKSLTLLEMKQQVEADLRIPTASMKMMLAGREMTAPLLSDYEWKEGQNNVSRCPCRGHRCARPSAGQIAGASRTCEALRETAFTCADPSFVSLTRAHLVSRAHALVSSSCRLFLSPQIELQIVYLEESAVPSSYVMPDVISVEVQFGVDIPPKLIQVPIVRAMPEKKPFLGGYRSRKNGVEYHHGSTQTDPAPRNLAADASDQKFHRETQTAVLQTRSQQSVREAGTQMPRGHLLQEEGDIVLRPLPTLTRPTSRAAIGKGDRSAALHARMVAALPRPLCAAHRRPRRRPRRRGGEAESEAEERHKLEIQRRMHPHFEFEILYNELEA